MFYNFLLAHLIADFLLQPLWLVRKKRHWDGLLIHVAVVGLCMLPIPFFMPLPPTGWLAIAAISIIHLIADRWKVTIGDKLFGCPLVPFMLDQAIHVGTLAIVLSLCLPLEQVWSLGALPFTREALMGAIYVVVAVATPIAVIVGFDPQFKHAALSGPARLRALVCGTAALVLTVVGGALVAPASLLGLALVMQRPVSPHPLDTPQGMAIVLAVGAALGWALTMV
jgi:hypothetical protein